MWKVCLVVGQKKKSEKFSMEIIGSCVVKGNISNTTNKKIEIISDNKRFQSFTDWQYLICKTLLLKFLKRAQKIMFESILVESRRQKIKKLTL